MSDTVLVALIGGLVSLAGTVITVLSNAAKTRKEYNTRLDSIEAKLDDHIRSDARESAECCRSRILRFANDVRHGVEFSKEYWDVILLDISRYDAYVALHADFKNGVCCHAIEYLENHYDELMDKNSFSF